MNNIENFLQENKILLNNYALNYFKNCETPKELKEAIIYSLVNEGKKIRPSLFFKQLNFYGYDYKKYIDIALAIELIHVYSLIHDDMPAMDNDDYRWGKLTNHKIFGEDIAILVGDAMQNTAYQIIADAKEISSEIKINLISFLSNYSGISGMLAGQIYDVKQNNYEINENYLKNMHKLKTSKLISLPLIFAACIANKKEDITLLNAYGNELGIAYQIKDDILDYYGDFKNTGKYYSDENKKTYLSFYGIDECELLLENHTNNAKKIANELKNNFLIELSDFLLNRKK